jgi:ribosome modulation factor
MKDVEIKEGYRIIKRGDIRVETRLTCSICECLIIDEIDDISISRSTCCFDCETEIVDPNRIKWLDGWRPSVDEIKATKLKRLHSSYIRSHI